MNESTPVNPSHKSYPVQNSGGKRKLATLIAAGTALIFLVAAVAFQFLKPKEGTAGENGTPAEASGRASVRGGTTRTALARVNNELIGYDNVANECMERYGAEVLESFINRTIIHQACRRAGIEVTQADVNAEVVKIAKKFDLTPENWYQIIQSERHLSRLQYQQDIIWPMLALKRLAGNDIKITEEDMRRVFLRDYGPRVNARMIMCDKVERAKEAWELVTKDPASFGKVARERSIDPGSKALDGKIQPIRMYGGNDNLEKEAFKLNENEISGIIDVSTPEAHRYVILLCEGRTTPIVKDINERGIREQVRKQIEEEKTQIEVAKVFERLKKEAQVENFLTQMSTRGIQQTSGTATGRDRVVPASGSRYRTAQPGTLRRSDAQSGDQQ